MSSQFTDPTLLYQTSIEQEINLAWRNTWKTRENNKRQDSNPRSLTPNVRALPLSQPGR